jgi:hypothetical protein
VPSSDKKVCQREREYNLLPHNAELATYREEFKEALAVTRPPAFNPRR